MNYCIFRSEKLKTLKDVTNVLKEQHRSTDYESKRADSALSYKNSMSSDYQTAQENFNRLLPGKIRKNAVLGLNFLVTTSTELEAEEERAYYSKARQYIGEHFGEVVGWAIHRDETSTHMQVVTIPLVDGKLNARALIGGDKNKMHTLQDDFYKQVGKPCGLARGKEGSVAKHTTVEEYHKDKSAEIDRREKLLAERERKFELQQKAANAARETASKFLPDRPEKILPDLDEIKTPETVKAVWKKGLAESPYQYAHRVVNSVFDWARRKVTKFEKKYNDLLKKLHDTSYALYNEKETTDRLKKKLEDYDYRKKTPEELEKIAQKKRSQTREKGRSGVNSDWER